MVVMYLMYLCATLKLYFIYKKKKTINIVNIGNIFFKNVYNGCKIGHNRT